MEVDVVFHEIVVIAKPLPKLVAGFGVALIASSELLAPVSLVAGVAADVVNRPFTPPGKNPPDEAFAEP